MQRSDRGSARRKVIPGDCEKSLLASRAEFGTLAPVIPTGKRVQYAIGYAQLGLFKEAAAELEAIVPAERNRPDVMAARVELHREAGEWEQVADYARQLLAVDASDLGAWISLGCAMRRVENVAAAKELLLLAEARLGEGHAIIHYNLACYHCLLGEPDEARRRLAEAWRLDASFRRIALDDPDLLAMRDEIAAMKRAADEK